MILLTDEGAATGFAALFTREIPLMQKLPFWSIFKAKMLQNGLYQALQQFTALAGQQTHRRDVDQRIAAEMTDFGHAGRGAGVSFF